MNYIEPLVQAEAIGSVTFQESPIFPIESKALLEVYIKGNGLTIMGRYEELLAFKLVSNYLRRSFESMLFQHPLGSCCMVVLVDLRVDKRGGERISKSTGVVVLIQAWSDLTHIVH
jgi:hypothetical protein